MREMIDWTTIKCARVGHNQSIEHDSGRAAQGVIRDIETDRYQLKS